MQDGYPFQFIGISTIGADKYLKCGVKFFDQTTDVRTGKFSQLSGTYEPRTIFRTVASIALDAYRRDPLSSFFFIGAADSRDRSSATTRRHRVYATFVHNLGVDNLFRTFELTNSSMSVLVNRNAVPDMDAYMQKILNFIAD